MIALRAATTPRDVVALAAHCDDLAIGAGAALARLARAGARVHAVVMSGAGTPREAEERAALARLTGCADLDLTVLDVPDGRAPSGFDRVKDAVVEVRDRVGTVDLVLAPQPGDAHQDHRLLAQIAPTVFRDHLVLGYEILKWESDLPAANAYLPLTAAELDAKLALLRECYPSQADHDWYDAEAFRGLARVRGVQCHAPYAEAFVTDKLTLTLGD